MDDFNMFIIVNGPRAKAQAEAIAKYYNVRCAELDDGSWKIECSKEIEKDICFSEEDMMQSCEKITAATGIFINFEDLEF